MTISGDDLRKVQLLQLKILKEVHRICEKHNIKYFLSDGTLIGAIRHQGFIPWDDDLDIGMLREEYGKFCTVCKTELSDEYFLQTMETEPDYGFVFGKMLLTETVWREKTSVNVVKKSGIYIDIFPFDCIPNESYKQFIQHIIAKVLIGSYLVKKGYRLMPKNIWKWYLYKFFSVFPSSPIRCLLHHVITKYSYLGVNKECLVSKFGGSYYRNRSSINNFRSLILAPFEDGMFYIPKGYDDFLSGLYGDYMTLPPVEKRIGGHDLIEYRF